MLMTCLLPTGQGPPFPSLYTGDYRSSKPRCGLRSYLLVVLSVYVDEYPC